MLTAKQGQVVRAYAILNLMGQQQLATPVAYKLFKLKKSLATVVEFQSEQERNLAEELGGSFGETGKLELPKDQRAEYEKRHKEMVETMCEVDCEKVKLKMSDIPTISMDVIEALDLFIDFKE